MTVICQLNETGRLLSVSYMGQVIGIWQNDAYLLVT
jgi:hypothetical protein